MKRLRRIVTDAGTRATCAAAAGVRPAGSVVRTLARYAFMLAAIAAAGGMPGGQTAAAAAETPPAPRETAQQQAQKVRHPERAPLLAAALAGTRVVAVGDFGVILLSDDDGNTWRQAESVPTRRTLTAVRFIDERHGWIVGHNGTVLHTDDAGEHWSTLTSPDPDTALFSVYFDDADHGLVAGAFGFVARTSDGGKNWEPFEITDEDPHLYRIFHDAEGATWITGEMGTVFRSNDGEVFEPVEVPYSGSFWGGMKAADGSLLLWGMSGTLLRSVDDGRSWRQTKTGTEHPITDACTTPDGRLVLVGLSGTVLTSRDSGASVSAQTHPDRRAYTSVIAVRGQPLLFSLEGTERPQQP